MTQIDLTLSENAARRIKAIAETEGRPLMLRVAVDGGGCSGFQYRFDLVETIEQDDLKVERDGAAALVDVVSLALLKGSEIDPTTPNFRRFTTNSWRWPTRLQPPT